jgi:hypothetical protein
MHKGSQSVEITAHDQANDRFSVRRVSVIDDQRSEDTESYARDELPSVAIALLVLGTCPAWSLVEDIVELRFDGLAYWKVRLLRDGRMIPVCRMRDPAGDEISEVADVPFAEAYEQDDLTQPDIVTTLVDFRRGKDTHVGVNNRSPAELLRDACKSTSRYLRPLCLASRSLDPGFNLSPGS